MNIKAIGDGFIFTFVEAVNSKGEFERTPTESGIFLASSVDDSAKYPRWVNVISAGPDCKLVKAGTQALLPSLRWTASCKFENKMIWKSDESQVAVVRTDPTDNIQAINKYVIFVQAVPTTVSKSGLFIISGANSDTPSGKTVTVSLDGSPILVGNTIYYSGANFFNVFEHNHTKLAFIKEDDVLAYVEE